MKLAAIMLIVPLAPCAFASFIMPFFNQIGLFAAPDKSHLNFLKSSAANGKDHAKNFFLCIIAAQQLDEFGGISS